MVLERSGRWLLVLLSLLVGTWGSSVSTADPRAGGSEGLSPTLDAGLSVYSTESPDAALDLWGCGFADAAVRLVEPPAGYAGMSSSLHNQSLPPVPRSVLMVLAGFLCISLVQDRKLWLTAAASILSVSQNGPNVVGAIFSQQRGRGHLRQGAPTHALSPQEERALPHLWQRVLPKLNVPDRERSNGLLAAVHPESYPDHELQSCWASDISSPELLCVQLTFVQLARGPPLLSAKTLSQPFLWRVDARKALPESGLTSPCWR